MLPPLGRGTDFEHPVNDRPALGRAGTCAAGRATPSPAPAATEVSFTASDVRRSARNREAVAAVSTGSDRGRAPCRPGPCRRSRRIPPGLGPMGRHRRRAPPRGVEPASGVVVHALASRCQLARRYGSPPSSALASVAVAWCAISECPNPGEFWAQIKWTGALGTETKGLLRPLAFCRDHSQSLRDGLPEGAIWLDKPPESE